MTKIKHIAADQIKTAFRFSFNAMWSSAPTTLTKQCYLTSSGASLKQRHVNKQKDDFSSVLQWKYLHLPMTFLRWTILDRVTLSLSDVTDKQMSWLVNVTFYWHQVMTTAVQRYGQTRCLITFLHHVFCTIDTESSQLIHRQDLKIRCKYKS